MALPASFIESRNRRMAAAEPFIQRARELFPAFLDLIRSAVSTRVACERLGVDRNHIRRLMKREPELYAQYQTAQDDTIAIRRAGLPEHIRKIWAARRKQVAESDSRRRLIHLDAVLALVEDGMSLRAACRSNPDFPTHGVVYGALQRDPALMARYKAANKHRRRKLPRPSSADIDAILAEVEGGTTLTDASRARGFQMTRVQYVLLNDPALRLRWDDAREKGVAATIWRSTMQHAEPILAAMESGLSLRKALAASPVPLNRATFRYGLALFDDIAARHDAAVEANRLNRRARSSLRLISIRNPAIVRTIHDDALFAKVNAVIPRWCDDALRDDVVGDTILAVLEGRISLDDISSHVRSLLGRHAGEMKRNLSLDAKLNQDSNTSRLELISATD